MRTLVSDSLLFLGIFFVVASFFFLRVPEASAGTPDDYGIVGEAVLIEADTVWRKADNLSFEMRVFVVNGATLTIEPGAQVFLNNEAGEDASGLLYVGDGAIQALGTPEEPILITAGVGRPFSIEFDDYPVGERKESLFEYVEIRQGGDLLGDGGGETSFWKELFIPTAKAEGLEGWGAVRYFVGKVSFEHVVFTENKFSDIEILYTYNEPDMPESYFHVKNSTFTRDSLRYAVHVTDDYCGFDECERIDFTFQDNWWGSPAGPEHAANPGGTGALIFGDIPFTPWLAAAPMSGCTEDCFSNILFLPGIKGSRLYKEGSLGTEDKLWLPNHFGDDFRDLELNEAGQSREDVYTRDVVEEALGTFNLYKSFLTQLENYKSAGVINDYEAFAYDWRQSIESIVQEGTPYSDGLMKSVIGEVERLAQDSKSQKVTIVAHSNGGLLAKALMIELERRGLTEKVDKVVLVGSPQMGTPLTILSLLYGYEESLMLGILYNNKDARALAENMPSAYGLLPSEDYLNRLTEPLISFLSQNTRYKDFRDAYGERISNYEELKDFLLGVDGRNDPAREEIERENVLSEALLEQARDMHRRLDAWTPPVGTQLIQVAGWGLDTISGVQYTEEEKKNCDFTKVIPVCQPNGEFEPVYDPVFTVDGDAVVTAPSALMLSEAPNVKRFWLNVQAYNESVNISRNHKSLFEIDPLQLFLRKIITNNLGLTLPEFIVTSSQNLIYGNKSRLRLSLYSPLDIHLYDRAGNHTGPKTAVQDGQEYTTFEEGIPNSYYYQFGERKYVGFPGGEDIRITMDGTGEGAYRLKLEEVVSGESGEQIVAHTEFTDLPTTAETTVHIEIPETGLADISPLVADLDSDGSAEYVLMAVPNGTATLDTTPPITDITLDGEQGSNGWYIGDVSITLSAADNVGGSGVAETRYSLDGGTTWNVYATPFVLSDEGSPEIRYYSVDEQGNQEEEKTQVVKIDKIAPEAQVVFNASTQKLDVLGEDNLAQPVSVAQSESTIVVSGPPLLRRHPLLGWIWETLAPKKEKKTYLTATLTDQAGHTTELFFEKKKELKNRIDLTLQSVAYGGAKTDLNQSAIQYKWAMDRKGQYQLLASHLTTPAARVESYYFPKKDQTVIMERPQELADEGDDEAERRPTRMKLPGMVIPAMITERGEIRIIY